MNTYGTFSARQSAQVVAGGLLVAVTLIIVLAVVVPMAAFVLMLALLVTGMLVLAQRAAGVARSAAHAVAGAAAPEAPAQPTLRLELPDGVVVNARPVPLPQASEHTMLLTRDGYVMVNAAGRVVYQYH